MVPTVSIVTIFFSPFELRFPYLDPPEERFILDALKQLYQFDAIDRSGFVVAGITLVV